MPSFSKFYCCAKFFSLHQSRHFSNISLRYLKPGLISSNSFLKDAKYVQRIFQPFRTAYTKEQKHQAQSYMYYLLSLAFFSLAGAFASVPLYDAFCQATSTGGVVQINVARDKVKSLKRVSNKEIQILFNADKSALLRWNFKPLQDQVVVAPGETVLAFYSAENPADEPIRGISTYNVAPYEAGQYFNKIQCFCFDEQQLNPHEQVDMPVFFFIDPEIMRDPFLKNIKTITLSYTFFETIEGLDLPFLSKH